MSTFYNILNTMANPCETHLFPVIIVEIKSPSGPGRLLLTSVGIDVPHSSIVLHLDDVIFYVGHSLTH